LSGTQSRPLQCTQALTVYALDLSATAVGIVRSHPLAEAGRVVAAVGDLTKGSLPPELSGCAADVATLMFVLSAIAPSKFGAALRAVRSGLRPGGAVLLRDYGAGDGACARMEAGREAKRLDASAPWLVRQDGTRAYFFSVGALRELFEREGFETLECAYAHRTTANRATGATLSRTFVTARFRRPASDALDAEFSAP